MKKRNWHRIACGTGLLMMALALFYCGLSVAGTVQDMRKFGGLGFSYTFVHYLKENDFGHSLWLLLWVMAEVVLYVSRRPQRTWLFAAMLVLHTGLWIHAMVLSVPAGVGYNPAGYYLRFAWMTLLPAVAYFVSNFLRTRESERKSPYK